MGLLFYVGVAGLIYFLFQLCRNLTAPSTAETRHNGRTQQIAKPRELKELSTAAALIKQRLQIKYSDPILTISANQVFWDGKSFTVDGGILADCIKYLSEIGTLYLIVMVKSDHDEELFKECFRNALSADFPLHRILFCETAIGKKAIIRQLEPHCYLDCDATVCRETAQRASSVVIFGEDGQGADAAGLIVMKALNDVLSSV